MIFPFIPALWLPLTHRAQHEGRGRRGRPRDDAGWEEHPWVLGGCAEAWPTPLWVPL